MANIFQGIIISKRLLKETLSLQAFAALGQEKKKEEKKASEEKVTQFGLFSLNNVTEDVIKMLGKLSLPQLLFNLVTSR